MKKIQHKAVKNNTNVRYQKINATDASTSRGDASITHHDKSRKAVKRKAGKPLHELEGEERRVALKMMKTSLNKTVQGHSKKPLGIPNVKSAEKGQEYQCASLLYDALKSNLLSSPRDGNQLLQFHGSYAIVAVSSIDNFKRLSLVATNLQKIARLSFQPDAISPPGPSGSVTLSFSCSCLGHAQVLTSPDIEWSKKGSLLEWFRRDGHPFASKAVPRMCGGKVNVTVSDDNTHPLVLGQQIIVRVEHPDI